MARVRKRSLSDEEEQEKIRRKGKRKESAPFEDDDEEGLDEFEVDGFIVDNIEDEEDGGEEENPNEMLKKKKKRKRSSKNIVLDDDDLELIRENKSTNQEKLSDGKFKRLKKTGIDAEPMENSSDDEGSFFDGIFEDESNDAEDDMEDFIVDEEVFVHGKGDSLRQKKFKGMKHSSTLSKEAKHRSGKAGLPEEHIGSDDPKNMYVAGEGNSLADTDIPERIQIIEDIVGSIPVDRMSIEEESSWILRQLASNINPLFSEAKSYIDSVNREDIVRFLELHHIKKYDIPFIATYRKEQCPSLLEDPKQDGSENTLLNDTEGKPKLNRHRILWIIKELDKKWLLLQKRKSMLMRYYNKRFEEEFQMSFSVEESSFRKQIFDSVTNMLEKAETEREIDDVDMKFNLYFPPADEFSSIGYKRPLLKSYYSDCRKAGLSSLARKFGNPEKFGSLVTLNKVGMDSEEDPEESLEEMASIYKCETFQTSEAVLKGARHMAALMLSCEVPFRKYVRSIFMDKAIVSTSPTLKGNIAIDSFHKFASFKWLKDKPLLKFEDSQWLLIQKAEEEKLLQVEIKLPNHAVDELTMTCNNAYLKDNEGTFTQQWNEQRKSILQDTISNFLLPSMEKEARALLNAKAKNWSLMKFGMDLWNRVSVAPYRNNDNVNAQERGVVACCWGNGKPGTTFVMLDARGEMVDVMHAGSLTLRSQNINDQQRRKNDQKCVLKFLTIHRPNVIVVGAANASCIKLKEDISEIISMMSEDNFQDASHEMNGLPAVVLGEEGLPCLYEDSEISISQLPRQYGIVKRAVALGRYLLNPLAMVATLCGVNKEVVSWKLNPMEKFLSSDEKMEMIEWIMMDITNQVGIDINLAIRHDWLLAPLQFVSGLGPRKAGILHRELLGGTDVRNRRDLAKFGLNTKKVFCNAVGFLQVSCNDPNFVDTAGNILDRTRIHPESYSLAEELARAVVHRHYTDANDIQLNAIECIQNDPKLLESFDVNEYAERLETEKGEYRRVTLSDIKMELLHGFKDPRSPYTEPTQDDEFYMITGETGVVLVEGERVQATVRRVQARLAFCVLDSGMPGILFREDFSDKIGDKPLTEKLREGVVLTCKIKLVDKNRCQVNLTCKMSELKNVGEQSFHDMDPYYCQGDIILPSQQEATDKKGLVNKNFMPRTVSHPHFQNISADQAKEFLADKAVGEYIFHPSSRGLCYLTLTLKFFDALYVHKDILEGGKSHDMKSLLGLGKTLKIGEEIFENIDKVIENYVSPLVVHLKALINFRKFKKGSKAEVDELLKLEKEEYPNRIPYGLGISYEHPGIFMLSYIRSTNPHHEFIAIHPKGFKFRKQIFNTVEQLVAYFQSHINDNIARAKDQATESMSGGWKSNNVDQFNQSKDYNDHGDGRGAGGRGRGRGGGGACYKCGESGHMARDCSQGGGGGGQGGGGGACYKCGESGHMARDCSQGGGRGGRGGGGGGSCYKCGESGHMARDCSQGGGGGRGSDVGSFAAGKSWGLDASGEGSGREGEQNICGGSGNENSSSGWGGWGGTDGKSWGGSSTKEESNIAEGSWGLTAANNDGSGNEHSGWSGATGKNTTPSGGGSGWGGTGGKSWGGNSANEETNIAKGSWGLSAASNAGSGNENPGWSGSHAKNATPYDGGSGWGGTGGKSWGGNSTNEESNIAKGGWGLTAASNTGSGNENSGWCGSHGKNATPSSGESAWGGTGAKSWGGNSTNEESNIVDGGGGGACYKCGESGHMARDCNQGSGGGGGQGRGGGRGGGGVCYKCGESGHMARECSQGGGGGGRGGGGGVCYKCGESGHMARECSQGGGGGGRVGGGVCYKCGESGHMARECSQGGGGACYKCGELGHMARECSQGGGGGGRGGGGGGTCYKCGESGHMARECSQGGGGACYKCGESGHMARECSQGGGGGQGGRRGGGGACYKCGESGHMARDCNQGSVGGGGRGSGYDETFAAGKSWGLGGSGEGSGSGSGSGREGEQNICAASGNENSSSGWGGAGGGSGWGGTGGKSWGGSSTNEESNTAKGSWGPTFGNENSEWGGSNMKSATPSGGGSGWGGTGGKSWGGTSTNEESNTAKGSWGPTVTSNAGSGNEKSGWGGSNGKNATPSGGESGLEGTGGGSGWGGAGGGS